MKNVIYPVLILLFTIFQSCDKCDNEDGKWEAMKWENEIQISDYNNIIVPAAGGEYTFSCLNYSPWLINATEIYKNDCKEFIRDNDLYKIETSFASIKIINKKLIVTILPNGTPERTLKVLVTAGDVFAYFTFNQGTLLCY